MKTKVTIISRKFYVDKNKKAITCVIKSVLNTDVCECIYLGDMWTNLKNKFNFYPPYSTLTFTATTKCHKGDKFDDIKGKRIAESKAKAKMFKYYARMLSSIENSLNTNILSKIIRLKSANNYAYNREKRHVKELDV